MYFAERGSHAGSLHSCFADELSTASRGPEAWPLRWPRVPHEVSFFEQPLQPVQVALHESGVGGELRVGHAGLAKESKQQLTAAAIGDQSHGDVNALAGGADDSMVDNTEAVPRRELHPGDSTVTVWAPARAGRLPQAQLSNPITTVRRTILRSLFMLETLRVSCDGCLERIGQSALHLGDEFARGCAAHTLDFAGHVRLVGVACARGHVGEVVLFGPSRKPEEPLEAKHAVQRLESIAEGIQAPAAQGALAQAYMRRQLIDPESRGHAVVACGPAQERDLRVGEPDGGQSARAGLRGLRPAV